MFTILINIFVRGLIVSLNVFLQYYEQTTLSNVAETTISWIGTLSGFLVFFVGIFSGPTYNTVLARWLFGFGSALIVLGLMMTSLAREYYQIMLAHCVCIGIGAGTLWIPSITLIATRFEADQRAFAIGITMSGSSIGEWYSSREHRRSIKRNNTNDEVGGIVYPMMFKTLETSIGFSWSVRACGFFTLGVVAVALTLLLRIQPTKSPSTSPLLDTSAFREPHFMILNFAGIFAMTAYFLVLQYLPTYAETHLKGNIPESLPFYTPALINASSTISRVIAGLITPIFGLLETYVVALVCCTILALTWLAVDDWTDLVIWCILWGMASGVIVSLPPAIMPSFCPNPSLIGSRMGMIMFPAGIGMLTGSPLANIIMHQSRPDKQTNWWPLRILVVFDMAFALSLCFPVLVHIRRRRIQAQIK